MFFQFAARPSRRAVRTAAVTTGGLLAAATLGACGGSSAGGSASSGSGTPSAPSRSSSAGDLGGGARGPAASGLVAAITGTTMQVQNPQAGQVAVTWTSTTKFSHTVQTTLASIKAGACVTAVAPSGTSASATAFTATTVLLSAPVKGSCPGPFRIAAGGGKRPSGFPSGLPSGKRFSGAPGRSGAAGKGGFGAIATGKVTSVSGSTIVVAARSLGPATGSASPSSSTTRKSVTVGSATKITTEAATTAAALKVGECVTAQGKADSTGTVTATSVRITPATDGQCTIGFGGGPTSG
jgi:uncharacterized protein DUF5666